MEEDDSEEMDDSDIGGTNNSYINHNDYGSGQQKRRKSNDIGDKIEMDEEENNELRIRSPLREPMEIEIQDRQTKNMSDKMCKLQIL